MVINSYSYLQRLEQDLDAAEQSGKRVHLKIEGKGQERHVEMVKGIWDNCFAAIGRLLGLSKYDVEEIATVLQTQIKQIQPHDQQTARTVNHLAQTFLYQVEEKLSTETIQQIQSLTKAQKAEQQDSKMALELVEILEYCSGKIEESTRQKLLEAVKASNEDQVITAKVIHTLQPKMGQDPVFKEFEKKQTILYFQDVFLNSLGIDLTTDLSFQNFEERRILFIRDIGMVHSDAKEGSLAKGVYYRFLNTIPRFTEKPPESLWDLGQALFEANILLNQNKQRPLDKLQYQRAELILELRSLVRKAQVILNTQFDHELELIANENLLTITDERVDELFEHVEMLLKPQAWSSEIRERGTIVSLPFTTLIAEWQDHRKQLQSDERNIVHTMPLDRLEYKDPLRKRMLQRMKQEYKRFKHEIPRFSTMQGRFKEAEFLIRQQKRAEFLIELRTFVQEAQDFIGDPPAKKDQRLANNLNLLLKELAASDNIDTFSEKRLNEISVGELGALFESVKRTLSPLTTRGFQYGLLKRDAQEHFNNIK